MAMNRIQFQAGLSLPAFLAQFGTDEQCADALEASRWPQGFSCPGCGNANYYLLKVGKHKNFQCKCCRLQTSLIAGTLFQSTHLALSIWFLAIYLISQAKTGLSALDLKRQLGVSYPTAWLIQQKLMQAMVERDAKYTLSGNVQADDAYLGGGRGRPHSWRSPPAPPPPIKCLVEPGFVAPPPPRSLTGVFLLLFSRPRPPASSTIPHHPPRFWAPHTRLGAYHFSISPNPDPVPSVCFFTVSPRVFISRSPSVCPSPPPPIGPPPTRWLQQAEESC